MTQYELKKESHLSTQAVKLVDNGNLLAISKESRAVRNTPMNSYA